MKLMWGSMFGGAVVVSLVVFLVPDPLPGTTKWAAFFFYWGLICVLVGCLSAVRALRVKATNVIYAEASAVWWSLTAFVVSFGANLWVPALRLPIPMSLILTFIMVNLCIASAQASRRLVDAARRAHESAGSLPARRDPEQGELG